MLRLVLHGGYGPAMWMGMRDICIPERSIMHNYDVILVRDVNVLKWQGHGHILIIRFILPVFNTDAILEIREVLNVIHDMLVGEVLGRICVCINYNYTDGKWAIGKAAQQLAVTASRRGVYAVGVSYSRVLTVASVPTCAGNSRSQLAFADVLRRTVDPRGNYPNGVRYGLWDDIIFQYKLFVTLIPMSAMYSTGCMWNLS